MNYLLFCVVFITLSTNIVSKKSHPNLDLKSTSPMASPVQNKASPTPQPSPDGEDDSGPSESEYEEDTMVAETGSDLANYNQNKS